MWDVAGACLRTHHDVWPACGEERSSYPFPARASQACCHLEVFSCGVIVFCEQERSACERHNPEQFGGWLVGNPYAMVHPSRCVIGYP